ncbi:MAG: antirestriction protein ArdA [Cyanobacteria bacterium P01_D01_bin.56]
MSNVATRMKGQGDEVPAIYVADLADYNAGILRGKWIKINGDTTVEELREEITVMLAEKGHEEYAIHDYNNFPGASELGEFPDLSQLIEVVRAVDDHGYVLASAYLIYFPINELDQIGDRFLGFYDCLGDYAHDLVDSTIDLERAIGNLSYYFDYAAYGNDIEMNGEIVSFNLNTCCDGRIAIFSTR